MPVVSGRAVVVQDESTDDAHWASPDGGSFEYVEAPWTWPSGVVDPWSDLQLVAVPDGGFAALLTLYGVHPDEEDLPDDRRDNATLKFAVITVIILPLLPNKAYGPTEALTVLTPFKIWRRVSC